METPPPHDLLPIESGKYGIGAARPSELDQVESPWPEHVAPPDVMLAGLPDPELGLDEGAYAASGLRTITGTKINPYAVDLYGAQASYLASARDAIITGMHPDLEAWIKFLGGGDAEWHMRQRPIEDLPLSRVLPRLVMTGGAWPPWPIPKGSYWIDYSNFSRHRTKIPESDWTQNVRDRFPDDCQLVLGPIQDHAVRITMWNLRHQLWESDFLKQFDAVVCPDFSSYVNDPYPQALLGERMTQIWSEWASRYGVNVIPIISWTSEDSLARQADRLGALIEAGHVHTIYIEWLARRVEKDHWLFHRFEAFQRHLAHLPVRWMFSGVEAGWSMRKLHEILPQGNFHVVGIWPWMRTRFEPGLSEQKARIFRNKLHTIEQMHRNEIPMPPKERPEGLGPGIAKPKLGDRRGT